MYWGPQPFLKALSAPGAFGMSKGACIGSAHLRQVELDDEFLIMVVELDVEAKIGIAAIAVDVST